VLNGIASSATEDGWSISYDRLLISIGDISLDGSNCSTYSQASYSRVLDMNTAGAQKVSESFALGQCDFGFGLVNPADDSLSGSGVSTSDVVFMRTAGTDKYAGPSGTSIFVQGHADRAGATKTFSWAFRQQLRFRDCRQSADPSSMHGVLLAENGAATLNLMVRGEALFQDNTDLSLAKLRFDPIAAADTVSGNGDGDVSLDELAAVPLAILASTGGYLASGSSAAAKTLEDYIYLSSFPAVINFGDTGVCTISIGKGDR
jgi:hypothetical protein